MFVHTVCFLTEVFGPGDIVELRVMLKDVSIVAGRFTDLRKMAVVAQEIDTEWPEAAAVYFTINPIDPVAASRIGDFKANSVRSRVRTTRDRDVAQRTLYLLDFDPIRPAGVCATQGEKKAAYACLLRVRDYLRREGWPEPIVVDSGNGYHCYFQGDRCSPASPEWPRVLKYLDATFGSATVKVDTAVGNPARVSRLPGTMNRKGASTPDRPHRRSMVVEYPAQWAPLDHGKIYRLASRAGLIPTGGGSTGGHADMPELAENVEELLHEFFDEYQDNLDIAGEFEREGVKYFALRECPFAGRAHSGNLGKTCITLSERSVGFSCFSDDCADHTFQDLRHVLADVSGHASAIEFYVRPGDDEMIEEILALAEKVWGVTPDEMCPVDDPSRVLSAADVKRMIRGEA